MNINDRELTNFRQNRLGGIDADWDNNGETMPYTLTVDEESLVTEDITPFNSQSYADAKKLSAKNAIDLAAGKARLKYASQGWGVESEYRLAAAEVVQWRTGGSDVNNPPPSLEAWSTASGMTVEDAALDIEAQEGIFNNLLNGIRLIRLTGKAAVEAATSDFSTVAQPYIDQLNAI